MLKNGMANRLKILFLCTGNSCRSQMAEGWARQLKGEALEPFSAGIDPRPLDPLAVRVMAEAGVDISAQRSKSLSELQNLPFDCVVTVCSQAAETCPVFPGWAKVIRAGFDDPPKLAANAKTEAEALWHYRRVRDQIRSFIERLGMVQNGFLDIECDKVDAAPPPRLESGEPARRWPGTPLLL